ncbi:hypothetical protein ACQ4PT_012023 [Festuca glaucescens]
MHLSYSQRQRRRRPAARHPPVRPSHHLFDAMPPRKKHKSAPQVSVPDRIGDLPDCILQHVLSFLPAQAAVRTCVLARRWRDLWRSTRALRIVNLHDEIQYIRKFVDHLLILRERTDLDTVEIKLSCEYWEEDVAYVNLWIRFAVMYNVRVLTLHVSHRYLHLHDLPLASRHLTTLDLYGLDLEKNVLDFASCPALENLKMTRCEIYAAMLGPNHKVEIKGCYSSTEKSSAISEHLNIVEIKCNVVDEKILKVMKFLKAFNILGREGEEKSERRSGLDLSFIDVRTEFIDGSSEGAAAQPVRGGAMPPGRRPEGAPPPVYGSGTRYFTLEINHGGYFLGEGCNRSYVNGHVIWYDEVDSLTWSPVMLENIVEEIGYEMSGRIKAHYCIPFLTVMRNGLREIRDEYDTDQMVTFVGCGYQFISVYLDHDESLRTRDWDDVVQFPVAPLPAVISPIKPIQVVNAGDDPVAEEANEHAIHPVGGTVRQRKRARKEEAYVHEVDESDEEDEADSVDEDSDYDPGDILDSEYDINEGDDDLYEDNVDGEDEDVTVEKRSFDKEKGGSSTEKGKEKICKEEDSEGEDLWAPDSDEETRPARLNTFREQDLKNPQFHVGQLFDSVEMLRRAVQAYSCINMQDIKMPVNDRTRLRAKCEGHCSWYLWASYDNRHKCFMGLISAVRIVFPDSEHRFCVRHMWQNFSQLFRGDVLKNQLWKIARSSTVTRFEANMAAMKVLHPGAWAWLDELDPKTWVRAFQSDLPKCDVLLNNNCVVFNKYILEARELPVMSMFDKIKCQIMTRHYNKQKEEDKWPGDICPKIKKRVEKNVDLAKNCFVDGAGDGMFQVSEVWSSTPIDYIVDLKSKTCTCNRWQKSGIPCPHVLSCMREERKDPLSLVDTCYSTEMHKRAYGTIVYPCKDKTEWEKVDGPPILPPLFTKHVGRPTKSRRKTPGEVDCRGGGKRMSRHGVIMHCSYCSRPDHNKKGCYWLKNGLPPPEASQMNAPLPMQPNAQVPPPSQSTAPQEQPPEARSDTRVPYQDSMVDTMAQQRPPVRNVEAMPTPESTFIAAAHTMATQGQTSSSTTLRQGELAQKLLAMQQQKNKAMEDRKLAILEAKYEAQVKKIEEAAKRRAEQEKRKAELAQARAAEVAAKREKKKQDAEINKLAKARTKEIIADVKRELAEKRKQEAAENKKQEVADKKKQAHLRRIPVIKMVLLPLSLQWLKKCACLMS